MNNLHFAVVVGINRYPKIGDLHGPVDDAERFAGWLAAPSGGGLPDENIERRVSSPGGAAVADDERPTELDVWGAIRSFQEKADEIVAADLGQWEQTRLYLFVAGHGITPAGGHGALLTANASYREPGHHIEVGRYRDFSAVNGHFREVVIFADCCRRFVHGAVLMPPPFLLRESGRPVRTLVGYGCALGELAFEGPDGPDDNPSDRRGYFTDALVRGLETAYDPRFGAVSSHTLQGYVRNDVADRAARNGRRQSAEILPSADDILFGPVGDPPARHRLTIRLPGDATGRFELVDGTFALVESWQAGSPTWATTVPSGLYCVLPEGAVPDRTSIVLGPFTVTGDLDVPA